MNERLIQDLDRCTSSIKAYHSSLDLATSDMTPPSMDLTNILNSKGAAAAAAAAAGPHTDQHLQQQFPHRNGHIMHDSNSERANSPHGSEHSSRYSGPGMGQMNAGMRYPSPTAMQNPLPMLSNYRNDSTFEHPVMQQQNISRAPGGPTPENNTPRKAFECSVCGKDFARRSDLARHGESRVTSLCRCEIMLIGVHRANPQWRPTSCLRLS